MPFNRKFRQQYRKIFKRDPLAANLFLLLAELAGPDGTVILPRDPHEIDQELTDLLRVRFEDPCMRQL